jgi:hypothetical protein
MCFNVVAVAGEGFKALVEGMTSLPDLHRLEFTMKINTLGLPGVQHLVERFKRMETLNELVLDLSQNSLENAGAEELANFIKKNCDKLKVLSLGLEKNDISKHRHETLPS